MSNKRGNVKLRLHLVKWQFDGMGQVSPFENANNR
jgi:hypothetical protein